MSVPIEQYNQMQNTWMIITILLAIVPVVIVLVLWFVKNLLRSKSGKIIDNVKSSHKQLLLAATPSHRGNLFKVHSFIPGVLQTTTFDKRIKNKRKVFYEAEKTQIALDVSDFTNGAALSEDDKKMRLAITQDCLNFILDNNTKKVYLEDSVPLTIAVEDKVITTGIPGIGAMAYLEKLFTINSLKEKITVMKQSAAFKDVAFYLESLASQLTVIDIDVLRNYFNADWNQSNDDIKHDLHWTMGYREKNKGDNPFQKWILIAGFVVLGIGVGALIAAIMLVKK
jgi:hypothetical protein